MRSAFILSSRAAKHIEDALGLSSPKNAVLLTDGYVAYSHYANKIGITHVMIIPTRFISALARCRFFLDAARH